MPCLTWNGWFLLSLPALQNSCTTPVHRLAPFGVYHPTYHHTGLGSVCLGFMHVCLHALCSRGACRLTPAVIPSYTHIFTHVNKNVRVRCTHSQRVGEPGLSPHLLKQAPSSGLPSQSGKGKGMLGPSSWWVRQCRRSLPLGIWREQWKESSGSSLVS